MARWMTISRVLVRHEEEEKGTRDFLTENEIKSLWFGYSRFVGVTLYGADGRCSACSAVEYIQLACCSNPSLPGESRWDVGCLVIISLIRTVTLLPA
jgi:hypothetical protein